MRPFSPHITSAAVSFYSSTSLYPHFSSLQSSVTLCNLGVGATFGESILHDLPRDSTVVTKTTCELLRVEQQDFRLIWEVSIALGIYMSTIYTYAHT